MASLRLLLAATMANSMPSTATVVSVPGFPVIVYDNLGNTAALNYSSPVLANFDGDPEPEIWINHFCDTIVFDKDGTQLTHTEAYGASDKPTMYMFYAWCLANTPAVGDIDNDGKLEIVRGGGNDQANGWQRAALRLGIEPRRTGDDSLAHVSPRRGAPRDISDQFLLQPTPAS